VNLLHYRGDCTDFDPDHVMGPDMYGGHWIPTGASYDADADMTTLTMRIVPPAELEERRESS
jgi:hypothetical protein